MKQTTLMITLVAVLVGGATASFVGAADRVVLGEYFTNQL